MGWKIGVLVTLVVINMGAAQPASAQQMGLPAPDREQRFGPNRLGVDLGVLAASLSYARQLTPRSEWGVALAGGAQTGWIPGSSERVGDDALNLFVELISASLFLRGDVGSRAELEGGVRAGWFYHTTEYETIFAGVYTALQYRIGAWRIGPRIYLGRMSEESGSEYAFAVVPLTAGFRWSW